MMARTLRYTNKLIVGQQQWMLMVGARNDLPAGLGVGVG